MMRQIYLITWAWFDNSGYGIVRGYESEAMADRDFAFVKEHGNDAKRYKLQDTVLESADTPEPEAIEALLEQIRDTQAQIDIKLRVIKALDDAEAARKQKVTP